MNRGIKVPYELIANPNVKQSAAFVKMNLIRVWEQDNEAIVSVSRAYLISRMPT